MRLQEKARFLRLGDEVLVDLWHFQSDVDSLCQQNSLTIIMANASKDDVNPLTLVIISSDSSMVVDTFGIPIFMASVAA